MTSKELRDKVFSLLPYVTEVNAKENFIELTRQGTVLIDSYKEELKDERHFNALCHLTCHLFSRALSESEKFTNFFYEEKEVKS